MKIGSSMSMLVMLNSILLLWNFCVASVNIVFLYKEIMTRMCSGEVEFNELSVFSMECSNEFLKDNKLYCSLTLYPIVFHPNAHVTMCI